MRWAKAAAWAAVLLLAAFFWLQLQWARMVNEMNVYHLGHCAQSLAGQEMRAPGQWP